MTVLLLIFEIVGICFLLVPTGTLNSPFIWYAINPVIIAASYLPIYYGWVILLIYSVTSIIAFNQITGISIGTETFEDNAHIFLLFILITLAIQLLTYVSKQLAENNALLKKQSTELEVMNNKLMEANKKNGEFLDHFVELNDKLLLFEEQNRIANEIHDSVSQRLFSIVYAIHAMKRNPGKENFNEQLNLIEQCSRTASQELRKVIYRLSSKKNKANQFIMSLQTYLEQISKLNKAEIHLYAVNEVENFTIDKKQMILRIISESIGNALRHGKASKIDVKIYKKENHFYLIVNDNGSGFDLASENTTHGLGLSNIKELVNNLKGQIHLESIVGEGTQLTIDWSCQSDTNVMEVS
jgi:signal transduction histidine kinase